MTEAEKWGTLWRVLAVTVPLGTLVGFGLSLLIGAAGSSAAAGAVIGLLVTAGMVTFNVSWAIGLVPRRWREAPFLVVLQGSSNEPRRGFVDGLPWTRTFESTTENETRITHLVYYIVLDPAAGEPTMVATTSTASEGDENLNAEVLDRMVERLTFP